MRLVEFAVRGFQSYREEQSVRIEDQVTLLAGRNNVGKSALLRALQMPLDAQDGAHDDFALVYTWRATAEELAGGFAVSDSGWTDIIAEIRSGGEQDVRATFVAAGDPTPVLHCVRLELPTLGWLAEGQPEHKIGWTSGPLQGGATATSELIDVLFAAARRMVPIAPRRVEQGARTLTQQDRLMADCRNLADVLANVQLNKPTTTYRALLGFMQGAFPDVEAVTVATKRDQPGSTLIGEPHVVFFGREEPVPLRSCGTGVEQLLALGVGVLGADAPHIFLIDEPQAYLHPHAERSLQNLIGSHPEHQYIIATHSHLLLRTRPLSQTRLLTLENGATRVTEVEDGAKLLGELGVTAADLWLADRILWVEGAADEEVFDVLLQRELSDAQRLTLAVKRMPEAASRFAAGDRNARNAYRFCRDITAAIAPLDIAMMFLFDNDEKRHVDRRRIDEASRGMARFLPVREVENLFLEPALVYAFLEERCVAYELEPPNEEEVAQLLTEVLDMVDDTKLYPGGKPAEEEDARRVVRGSQVLSALTWQFTTTPYDKVRDGRRLAELAAEDHRELLADLRAVLHALVAPAS